MRKRRAKLLSLALAVTLAVSSAAPGIPAYASEIQQESSGLPSEGNEALPQEEDGLPSEDAEVPAENEETPLEDVETPSEDVEVPTQEGEAPSEEAKAPSKEQKAPSEEAKEPAAETEAPVEDGVETVAEGEAQVDTMPGLAAAYYSTKGSGTNVSFDRLMANSVDYDINYPDDMDAKLASQTGLTDNAGVSWTGRIKVPVTGDYTFYGYSDNGFRLWINGERLINYWDGNSWDILQTTKKVHLEADTYYTFQADYFEYAGGSHVYLDWSNDQGMARTRVPETAYFLPEDYAGLYISGVDTSKANLKDEEAFDGHVTAEGLNFTDKTVFEVVKLSGASLPTPAVAEVLSVTGTKAELNLPKLGTGVYKLKAYEESNNVQWNGKVIVEPGSTTGQARAEHPRPDWRRTDYVNLNGWWNFAFDQKEVGQDEGWFEADAEISESYINVPFCWESSLSGVQNENYKGQAWYQKKVMVDGSWAGKKIFLRFGAVDWMCKLWVNGEEVGSHIGGYNAFEFDVTEQMNVGEVNTVTLWVEDKGNYGDDSYPALIGKQGRNAPCGYTHTSGIWQTVGMEARSATYVGNAEAAVDVDNSTVTYTLDVTSDVDQELTVEYDFTSKIYDIAKDEDVPTGSTVKGAKKISVKAGENRLPMEAITVENPKLWNFDDPNLYYGKLTVKNSAGAVLDTVDTYFGMRKVEAKYFDESLGVKYIYVNGAPVFMSGLLDQGFWEEGIYTAPSEEALKYDILKMRECGFNLIRKHLKVEDPLQYYWCDKLGMMVWQDMPHATNMVPDKTGDVTLGRQYYEECLDSMMHMNYNHPSIVAVMLFNETWGLQKAYFDGKRNVVAADGKDTKAWVEGLFAKTKEINPNLLVEDMSPCNFDHVQPTEMNTYHMYPGNYNSTVNDVERHINGAYVGSKENFKFGEVQDGDPLLNSEYGGVGAYAGDYDVSYCFKYMTDIQRRYEKQSGFVYTEPFDVEYERNGILTYDRNMKIFGYDEIAYGGDMTMNDLLQELYVGIVDMPVRNVVPGQKMKTSVMAIGWTNDLPERAVLKWRFDGTDIYGNSINTGIAGQKTISLSPYRKMTTTINYVTPLQACVGTLTVWLESLDGTKLAKNFTNVIVSDDTVGDKASTTTNEDGSVVMRAKIGNSRMASSSENETQEYEYTLPEGFDLDSLNGMRVLAEASARKDQIGTDKNSSTFASQYSQTAIGRERPSDLTVSVNGVELDTVYLPDNPRDMRGTLSLNKAPGNQTGTSAGDFGYLINLNVTDEKLAAIKEAVGEDGKLTVAYQVKEDAKNQNGFRIYNSVYGRYAVNPTLILNPADQTVKGVLEEAQEMAVKGNNYSVEASLEKAESYVVRNEDGGYRVEVSADGSKVNVVNTKTNAMVASAAITGADTAHVVKTTLFDEQIRVYVDNNPEPVINVYDKSGFTGGVTVNAGAEDVAVTGESYETEEAEPKPELKDVDLTIDFSDADLDKSFQKMGNDLSANVTDGKLKMSGRNGDKLIIKDMEMADGVYEMDVKVDTVYNRPDFGSQSVAGGNSGFAFRSSGYLLGSDGLYGYYAGIGDGCIQLGRMANSWAQLALVWTHDVDMGQEHKLRVAVYGSRIQVYLDDETTPRIDVVDSVYSEGGAAIRNFQCASTLDNIKIVNVPYYTCSFEKGTDEWNGNGVWSKENGAYKTTGENTFSLVDGSAQRDIVIAADVKAEDEEALPSIVLRAKETANGMDGYRAVLNVKEDKIQLVKSVGGTDTVLAERGWDLEVGKFYRITAEAKGYGLKVYLEEKDAASRNGKEALFAVVDDSFAEKGLAGIYSAKGTSVFDNFSMNADFIDGAVMAPVITAGLEALVELANSLDPEVYTTASFAKVREALEAAENVSKFNQAEIDAVAEQLRKALGGLKENGTGTGVDLEKIAELLEQMSIERAKAEQAKQDALAAKADAEKLAQEAADKAAEALRQAEAAKNEKEAAKAQAEEAKKQADEAKKQVTEAQKQADAAQRQAEEAQRQADEAKRQAETAQENKEEAQRQAQEAQKQADEAKKQAAEAAQKVIDAQQQVVEAQKQVMEAQKQAAAAEAAAADATRQAEAAKSEKEAAERAAAEIASKLSVAEEKVQEAQRQVVEAQKQVLEAQRQAQEAQKQAELAKQEKEAAEKAAKEAAEKLAEAQRQAEEAKAAMKAAEEAAKKAAQALEEMKKKLKDGSLQEQIRVGDVYKSGSLKYKVTSVIERTVSVVGLAKSNATSINTKATIRIKGISYKVTAIANNAFKNNKKLTSVTIGQNVKSIGSKAFYQNKKLKTVIVGKNVKSIGSHAFYKASKLNTVTVYSKALKSVGKNAFKNIKKNAYIDVPDKKAKAYKKLLKKANPPKGAVIK